MENTQQELNALYEILAGTADATGEQFFRELARHLSAAIGVQYAFVSVFTSDDTRMRIMAFWNGERFVDIGEYDLRPTPCSQVVSGDVYFCPRDVQSFFPNDPHLKMLGAESYRGVPLVGPSGKHLGHLAAVDTKPMTEESRFITIMRVFATRAAAELDRVVAEQELSASEQRLEAVLQSAMDPIITIDDAHRIVVFNSAAERVFKQPAGGTIGKPISDLLLPQLNERLTICADGLLSGELHEAYISSNEGLSAVRADGENFTVEGTVSHVVIDGSDHCTVILRDVDERLEAERYIEQLTLEKSYLAEELRREQDADQIVGTSAALEQALQQAELVAGTDANVLVLGESGTGKELIVRAIHRKSKRSERPLITIDCTALPEALIESELFGHEKGSYTGAGEKRLGRFELAAGGTVFLDEIGELPMHLQPKLLRVIQEQKFQRVGGSETIDVDVRVVAATNRDLDARVAAGKFREDLFYRLNVFPIVMPPLRQRRDDIPELAKFFMNGFSRTVGRNLETIEASSLQRLLDYDWPGNIRELRNVIERSVILSTGRALTVDASLGVSLSQSTACPAPGASDDILTLVESEKRHILRALERTGGVVDGPKGAAKLLGINPNTLRSRMRKAGVDARRADT